VRLGEFFCLQARGPEATPFVCSKEFAASHRAVREMKEDGELPGRVKVRSRYVQKLKQPKVSQNYAARFNVVF
jgi:hypothetical protein